MFDVFYAGKQTLDFIDEMIMGFNGYTEYT